MSNNVFTTFEDKLNITKTLNSTPATAAITLDNVKTIYNGDDTTTGDNDDVTQPTLTIDKDLQTTFRIIDDTSTTPATQQTRTMSQSVAYGNLNMLTCRSSHIRSELLSNDIYVADNFTTKSDAFITENFNTLVKNVLKDNMGARVAPINNAGDITAKSIALWNSSTNQYEDLSTLFVNPRLPMTGNSINLTDSSITFATNSTLDNYDAISCLNSSQVSGKRLNITLGQSASQSATLSYLYSSTGANSTSLDIAVSGSGYKYHFTPTEATFDNNLSVASLSNTSDERKKESIETITNETANHIIDNIKPVKFIFKEDKSKQTHYGVIAQQVQQIAPELITTSSDGFLSMNYIELIPLLINKVQQQQKQIDELTQLVKYMKS